jgi:hypothetical protein
MTARQNRVGDAMVARMKGEGWFSICVMDGAMNDVAHDLDLPLWRGMNPHPLNRAQVAASYLARDSRFETKHIHAHDSLGRARVLRLFVLGEAFR